MRFKYFLRKLKVLTKRIYFYEFKYKRIVIEAIFLTGIARFCILFIPFRKIASFIGHSKFETPTAVDEAQLTYASEIGYLVEKVAQYTPWESKCLVMALTAQFILKIRGMASTLYLGVAKDENNQLLAHAWLRYGDRILTGNGEKDKFKLIAFFSTYKS